MTECIEEIPNGFISFEKKEVENRLHLLFKARLPLRFSAQVIWEQMDFGFSGRQASWLWAGQSSRSIAANPLKRGATTRTTYFFQSKKSPSGPLVESTYTYEMRRWEPESFLLEYHTGDDHPFNGGATVTLEPTSEKTCALHWDGLYEMDLSMDSIASQFGDYFPISMKAFQDAAPEA